MYPGTVAGTQVLLLSSPLVSCHTLQVGLHKGTMESPQCTEHRQPSWSCVTNTLDFLYRSSVMHVLAFFSSKVPCAMLLKP